MTFAELGDSPSGNPETNVVYENDFDVQSYNES